MLFRSNQLPSTDGNPKSNEDWKRMYQKKSNIKEGKGNETEATNTLAEEKEGWFLGS